MRSRKRGNTRSLVILLLLFIYIYHCQNDYVAEKVQGTLHDVSVSVCQCVSVSVCQCVSVSVCQRLLDDAMYIFSYFFSFFQALMYRTLPGAQ